MLINVIDEHLTNVEAEVIITTAAPDKLWLTLADIQIGGVAKDQYHQQLHLVMDQAPYPETRVVRARQSEEHGGKFKDVIFVIDDLDEPLEQLLCLGLTTASDLGYKSVALPPLLRQTTSHRISGRTDQKIQATVVALRKHAMCTQLESVTIATGEQLELAVHFETALALT